MLLIKLKSDKLDKLNTNRFFFQIIKAAASYLNILWTAIANSK